MKQFTAAILTLAIFTVPIVNAESKTIHHSGQASKHAVLASAHGVASTATVVSAVAAVPLVIAGGTSMMIGTVSLDAGASAIKSIQHNKPLVITDKTITVDPAPNQVIVIQNNIKTQGKD